MNIYWTHKKSICGLKHFVLVNELEINRNYYVILVSVLDSNINITIPKVELEKSGEWIIGWQECNKSESITADYDYSQETNADKSPKEIFLNESSPFNIS